jgi:hypothetical protein
VSDPGFLGLVRKHVRSVWSLELLLLLRSRLGQAWPAEDLVRELRASGPLISDCLTGLKASGLVAEDGGGWRYAPVTEELALFCDRLAEAYRTRPVAVINMIVAPSQVQDLANAFKFREEEDDR